MSDTEANKVKFETIFTKLKSFETADEHSELAKQLHDDVELALQVFVDMHKDDAEEITLRQSQPTYDEVDHTRSLSRQPKSLQELLRNVEEAATNQQKIKAVSTGHSELWNDIAKSDTNGFLIDTTSLNNTDLGIDQDVLQKGIDKATFCHVEAGATVEEVQKTLWPDDQRTTKSPENYRVLVNQTSSQSLSIGGTIATGAHGNGLRKPIQADIVASFRMITIDNNYKVKSFQIERTKGITDRKKFANKYPDVTLIQDDAKFYASVLNIGCMGIVYSYILRCEPAFYLQETYEMMALDKVKSKIASLFNNEGLYSFEIITNPYPGMVTVCTLRYVSADCHPVKVRPGVCPLLLKGLIKGVVSCSKHFPWTIPHLMDLLIRRLSKYPSTVLNACDARSTLAGVVPKGFSDVHVSECCMTAESPARIIEIIEKLLELYKRLYTKKHRQIVNVPSAFRFTAASYASMAMEYDSEKRPSVLIEQSILPGTPYADDTLREFRNTMETCFNGRHHWGMQHDMDSSRLKKLFPEKNRSAFVEALRFFDPKGLVANRFSDIVFGKYYDSISG